MRVRGALLLSVSATLARPSSSFTCGNCVILNRRSIYATVGQLRGGSGTPQSPSCPPLRRHSVIQASESSISSENIYFVMGGPGSGKGTQCAKLVERYGFVHLSAGDLLRKEVASGSEHGREIAKVIEEGKIVRSETTVRLLNEAMSESAGPFLIDGFPRSLENLDAFEESVCSCAFMLLLEVPESVLETRLLKRGLTSGRSDDNIDSIMKRFATFVRDSMPVIDRLEGRGRLRRIDASASEEDVFERVCTAFADQSLHESELVEA